MNTKSKTAQDIPSITNAGLKVAPFSNSSRFMELHKLDYKRNNLINKLEKSERDIKNIKRNLSIIEKDIASLMGKAEVELKTPETTAEKVDESHKTQLLKY